MRKYKFRGYSKRLKSWLYGSLVYANKKYYILPNSNDENVIKIKKYNRHLLVQAKEENRLVAPESIGEYTGLKNKDGKEIYEGDIVKAKVEEMYEVGNNEFKADILEVVGAIKFLNGCFCIYCNEYDFFSLENVIGGNQIEIIGNIFKNPELLEQG